MCPFNLMPSFNWHSPGRPRTNFLIQNTCIQYFMTRTIIVLFFLDVFDRDSLNSVCTTDYSFFWATTLQDKSEKSDRVANFNGSLRRASWNFPIILWGYLNLIPVLLWRCSPNSCKCKLRETCVNPWRTEEVGLFLRNLHRRTAKTKHIVVSRVKDNVILFTCYSYDSVNNSRNIYKQSYTKQESRMTEQFLSDANSNFTKQWSWHPEKVFIQSMKVSRQIRQTHSSYRLSLLASKSLEGIWQFQFPIILTLQQRVFSEIQIITVSWWCK